MTETGRVMEVSGKKTLVLQDKFANFEISGACFGCLRSGECKTRGGLISAKNPQGFPLKPGMKVETEIEGTSAQTMGALLPPIGGFIGGFFLTGLLFPAQGEPAKAFGGVLFMLAAGLCYYLFRRRFPPKSIPKILRIL